MCWSNLSLLIYSPGSFFLSLSQKSEPRPKQKERVKYFVIHVVFLACNELCYYSKIFISWGILQISSQSRMHGAKCEINNKKLLRYVARDYKGYH